ncbi:CHAT domain-containing protein [Kribbella pratensis]|uniref:CHAT domain-containing protein n=1 Tax=Kribbella pratensis TaxID=2512112 RepID=UPI001416F863|nr:CHAT domain-containing protein [Kribbella pratensis]
MGVHVAWALLHTDSVGPVSAVAAGVVRDTQDEAASTFAIAPQRSVDGAIDLERNVLVDPMLERATARLLGARLVPAVLRNSLNATADVHHTVHIAARGWLANVPWEAVSVDDRRNTRMVEKATLVSAMSPGIAATRSRLAPVADPASPGLAIVDAGPAEDPETGESAIYPGRLPAELIGAGGLDPGDTVAPGKYSMNAAEAGKALSARTWSRLMYLGHVASGRPEEPAAAALVFQRHGIRDPLTAGMWLAEPDRWPAPARVALIGCGSDDARFTEASGLPVAAINAGARLVTCTRWTLPTDRRHSAGLPATELALAVHHAHRSGAPIACLRGWQLERLAAWKDRPTYETSPLYWAALTSYVTPGGVDE